MQQRGFSLNIVLSSNSIYFVRYEIFGSLGFFSLSQYNVMPRRDNGRQIKLLDLPKSTGNPTVATKVSGYNG